MERRHILIDSSDGIDTNFMGYTHSSVRQPLGGKLPAIIVEQIEPLTEELPTPLAEPETWWQAAWRILNTDIFELWRTLWRKKR